MHPDKLTIMVGDLANERFDSIFVGGTGWLTVLRSPTILGLVQVGAFFLGEANLIWEIRVRGGSYAAVEQVED